MISRRKLLGALGVSALAAPFATRAQPKQRVYRLGILSSGSPKFVGHLIEAFLQGLRDLGYAEGRNILIERRFAEGNFDRLPALAADLVRQEVDVIFVAGTLAAQPARQATGNIPIVFANVQDAVGLGLVASLARPGGNLTGTSNVGPELSAKRLALLKETVPSASRVAVLVSRDASAAVQFAVVQRASRVLGLETLWVDVGNRGDLERAIALIRQWRADSMFVVQGPTTFYMQEPIAELAATLHLPSVCGTREFAEAGHLMSYGAHLEAIYRHTATYVDKILKGAKPSELPVEQPTRYELVINMRVAKALGLRVPREILLRADKVIE